MSIIHQDQVQEDAGTVMTRVPRPPILPTHGFTRHRLLEEHELLDLKLLHFIFIPTLAVMLNAAQGKRSRHPKLRSSWPFPFSSRYISFSFTASFFLSIVLSCYRLL
jgi:hypothetical protein